MKKGIEDLNKQGTLRNVLSSSGRAEELKGHQDAIRVALEELQVSVVDSMEVTSLISSLVSCSSVSILPIFSMNYVGFVGRRSDLRLTTLF